MIKVLFVCIHNSARSQMAEAFLNRLGEGRFIAESAGLEPGRLNPMVVESMAELGYDLSKNATNSVFTYHEEGRQYDLVIKVCDQAQGQRCPIFPSAKKALNWSFADPSSLTGSKEDIRRQVNEIRDKIRNEVEAFIINYTE